MSYNIALKNSEGMLAELFAPSRGVSKPLTNGFSDWYDAIFIGNVSHNKKQFILIYDPTQKKLKLLNQYTNNIEADFTTPVVFKSELEVLNFDFQEWWYG